MSEHIYLRFPVLNLLHCCLFMHCFCGYVLTEYIIGSDSDENSYLSNGSFSLYYKINVQAAFTLTSSSVFSLISNQKCNFLYQKGKLVFVVYCSVHVSF